ncbi:hypothetical protein OOK31_12650 [Streptomyces sp. NBC_00249]|uniref:hypothetical protein n=1 Tax=Streptomyces sp. NBC_00249 TaxID=2975690 RepID=UPI00224D86ED|nr:hypothetical protein [Streptomyces sp. NBC_00249]MCX5194736.1 hypothetical protein [Streptomyces sp. NBC_00249]
MSALKWQGWLVGLMALAGLLVFAPLTLYVWASGPAVEAVVPTARVTSCRIDPTSHRVLAALEATGEGSYLITVEFRDAEHPTPDTRTAQSLVRVPGLTPATPAQAEAVGPVWPPATTPWCGVASVSLSEPPAGSTR